eukprot:5083891-Amphidinium_carterae.1
MSGLRQNLEFGRSQSEFLPHKDRSARGTAAMFCRDGSLSAYPDSIVARIVGQRGDSIRQLEQDPASSS